MRSGKLFIKPGVNSVCAVRAGVLSKRGRKLNLFHMCCRELPECDRRIPVHHLQRRFIHVKLKWDHMHRGEDDTTNTSAPDSDEDRCVFEGFIYGFEGFIKLISVSVGSGVNTF